MRFNQFIYGLYPSTELWRPNIALILSALWLGFMAWPRFKWRSKVAFLGIFFGPVLIYRLLYDGFGFYPVVDTPEWGGLMLTFIISGVGIALSLPIGVLLALGRRSYLPVIKIFCVLFIELWRGVPLITVLFMASVMLPLFLPDGTHLDKLLRCLVGVTFFSSAYMAEVVRGGLQAVGKGQEEAAYSLGLGYWQTVFFVTVPQAIRLVIPGIMNSFIALFKDTSLVVIVGMFDLLGMVKAAFTNKEWSGFALEGYLFAGLVFWFFCYLMSKFSAYVEIRLNAGGR